ncbi:MAG: NADH-quinone oxidoreductase subunit NuoH [Chloroflexi bacterium]|nr:NADH-quinone oxidoreductase subunit NuoH [Chloroflexota bacterium]
MGIVVMAIILNFLALLVMVLQYMDRRLIARFQVRFGPNRVGPSGLLQPIADTIKLLTKEDLRPRLADPLVFTLAPLVVFLGGTLAFAVIPFNRSGFLADLNVGILYIFAITSLGAVGIFMAGWSSNNKYSLFGAMRAVAQLVAYEVPVVVSILGVVLITESLSLVDIVEKRDIPLILLQPLGFLIYLAAATAEVGRPPFDLLEAESELIAGYHTEYNGMRWALLQLGEYVATFAVAAVVTTLFLGGWKGPGPAVLGYVWFMLKALFVYLLILWVRASLPRVRIDQLMGFAWKFLLPLALLNVFITAAEALMWPDFPWLLVPVNIAIALGLVVLWSSLFQLRAYRKVEA